MPNTDGRVSFHCGYGDAPTPSEQASLPVWRSGERITEQEELTPANTPPDQSANKARSCAGQWGWF